MCASNQYLSQFEAIVEQTQHRLFRFAYMRIGMREDSEDLVQEVLLTLFRKLREGEKIRNIESYLLRSINNACIDYHRLKRPPIQSIDELGDVAVPDDDREMHDEYLRLKKLLNGLPPEQQETLRLKCFDDLTFRQIAELLQLPEATVKSRYRYALANLQKRLNDGK